MNVNAEKWLHELETTTKPQTQKCLRNAEGYCCLGIACELYQQEVGDLVVQDGLYGYQYDGSEGSLPEKVKTWLNMWTNVGGSRTNDTTSCFHMNDYLGMTFKQIAAQMRAFPKSYFKD